MKSIRSWSTIQIMLGMRACVREAQTGLAFFVYSHQAQLFSFGVNHSCRAAGSEEHYIFAAVDFAEKVLGGLHAVPDDYYWRAEVSPHGDVWDRVLYTDEGVTVVIRRHGRKKLAGLPELQHGLSDVGETRLG